MSFSFCYGMFASDVLTLLETWPNNGPNNGSLYNALRYYFEQFGTESAHSLEIFASVWVILGLYRLVFGTVLWLLWDNM